MIFILLFTVLLAFLFIRLYFNVQNLPPGPTPLPLIGNIHQLIFLVWREKGFIAAFGELRRKYGNVFTLWLGPYPHISIIDYDTNYEVFVRNGNKYKERDLIPFVEAYSDGHGFFGSNGESWAEIRKFTLATFRNMGVGRDLMEDKIMAELDARCLELDASATEGRTVISTAEFFDLTVGSVINSLLVGKRFDEHNKEEFFHLRKLQMKAAETFTLFDTSMPIWILKNVFPKRYESNVLSQLEVNDYIGRDAVERIRMIEEGSYELDKENPNDFLDAFIVKMMENEMDQRHAAFSMSSLKVVLGDLWAAGQDTTSGTLVMGFNQLVHHPEVIRALRAELLSVTDNHSRSLSLLDRPNTPYLNATIAEVQRHASVLSIGLWKIVPENSKIKTDSGEIPIQKGSLITAQIGAHHQNEQVFRNPTEFRPERFMENPELINQLIPFGIGKRSCVGENLARSELYLVLGNMVLRYNVKPHGAYPSVEDQLPYSAGKVPDKSGKLEFMKYD